MSYDGKTLTVKLTDVTLGQSVTLNTKVNIASVVGTQAYAGFTGGTGSTAGLLDILSWTYTPRP